MLNFGNGDIEFPVPNSAARARGVPEVKRKKKNWQTNCGNAIAEIGGNFFFCNNCGNGIVENREKKKLWEPNCGNAIAKIRESIFFFYSNCDNGIAKNGRKKIK